MNSGGSRCGYHCNEPQENTSSLLRSLLSLPELPDTVARSGVHCEYAGLNNHTIKSCVHPLFPQGKKELMRVRLSWHQLPCLSMLSILETFRPPIKNLATYMFYINTTLGWRYIVRQVKLPHIVPSGSILTLWSNSTDIDIFSVWHSAVEGGLYFLLIIWPPLYWLEIGLFGQGCGGSGRWMGGWWMERGAYDRWLLMGRDGVPMMYYVGTIQNWPDYFADQITNSWSSCFLQYHCP